MEHGHRAQPCKRRGGVFTREPGKRVHVCEAVGIAFKRPASERDVDVAAELEGARRREHHARHRPVGALAGDLEGHGGVRVDEAAVLAPGLADHRGGFGVVGPAALEERADALEHLALDPEDALVPEVLHEAGDERRVALGCVVEHALEVARDQDVHARRDRLHERTVAVVDARRQEVREHVVGVARHDEVAHGQAHAVRIVAREHVAEIARRDAEVDLGALFDLVGLDELAVGVEVVDDLGHEAADVDRVGRGEFHAFVGELLPEVRGEDLLDGALHVVEVALDGGDRDVAALLGRHLQVLDVAHLAMRIEDRDADAGHVHEARKGGLARVARGRRRDHDAAARVLERGAHELRQHAQGNVLEGGRGTVMQLEQEFVAHAGHGRHGDAREVVGIGALDALGELGFREVGEQDREDAQRRLAVREALEHVGRQDAGEELVAHIEATVVAQALEQGFAGIHAVFKASRAVVDHGGTSPKFGNNRFIVAQSLQKNRVSPQG